MLESIQNLDNLVLEFIQVNMRHYILDVLLPYITILGNYGFIWIVTAIVFLSQRKLKTTGITILTALLLCVLFGNFGIKLLVARPRPCDIDHEVILLIPRPTDYSFPSGHVMSSFASATVIFTNNRRFGIGAIMLGLVIAFSRLYLYVHYLTDVIGGIAIGIIIGYGSILLYKTIKNRQCFH